MHRPREDRHGLGPVRVLENRGRRAPLGGHLRRALLRRSLRPGLRVSIGARRGGLGGRLRLRLLGDGGDGRTDTSGDSHGTAIAGIIAGTGGPTNGQGMLGLAPAAKILPVRVTTTNQVTPETLAQGIVWATDHGAQVINVSMGSPSPDALLQKAVNYALGKNIVVVSSAGNDGQGENQPMYPAAYPGVLSVSGIDEAGAFWAPSESGRGISIAAPAADIYSTNDQNQYVRADGTSYAAAYVSAAAALLRSHEPNLTAGQIVRRIITTTSRHHDSPDSKLGYGELNPLAALSATNNPGAPDNPLLTAPPAAHASNDSFGVTPLVVAVTVVGALLAAGAVLLTRRRRAEDPRPVSSTVKAGRAPQDTKRKGQSGKAQRRKPTRRSH
ncbi:S8 family serine peptidase [Kitasatospora sp. LaBMicrA B282]|uniref:S8 family serine peptidase n=1 Tax=Kitasatospora sp. LaBMicrA B282 TaxID=3420949 RepID=UPI003D10D6D3